MPAARHAQTLRLFGLRLKDVRIQFGITLDEFAARLGVSPSHLCNLESGRREPSFGLLVDLANDLAVSLDYLMLGLPDRMHDSALIFRSDDELLGALVDAPAGTRRGTP